LVAVSQSHIIFTKFYCIQTDNKFAIRPYTTSAVTQGRARIIVYCIIQRPIQILLHNHAKILFPLKPVVQTIGFTYLLNEYTNSTISKSVYFITQPYSFGSISYYCISRMSRSLPSYSWNNCMIGNWNLKPSHEMLMQHIREDTQKMDFCNDSRNSNQFWSKKNQTPINGECKIRRK
jgi:hypothetical protein